VSLPLGRPIDSEQGGTFMLRASGLALVAAVGLTATLCQSEAQAQQAYGLTWGRTYNTQDWNRFYHYPYVYYPQNFYSSQYYKSADDLYYRYPQEMRVPIYNKAWHNMYPEGALYHSGHHFILDQF
jgi:hypothetical protein